VLLVVLILLLSASSSSPPLSTSPSSLHFSPFFLSFVCLSIIWTSHCSCFFCFFHILYSTSTVSSDHRERKIQNPVSFAAENVNRTRPPSSRTGQLSLYDPRGFPRRLLEGSKQQGISYTLLLLHDSHCKALITNNELVGRSQQHGRCWSRRVPPTHDFQDGKYWAHCCTTSI